MVRSHELRGGAAKAVTLSVALTVTGTLSRVEVEKVLKLWNVPVDSEELDALFAKCDKDGDGNISYKEFMAGLAR